MYDGRGRKSEIGGKAMSKTMSVRMDRENYEFLHEMAKEEGVIYLRLFETP